MAGQSAHLDPRKVREFAQDVQGTIRFYKDVTDRLEGRLSQLGKTWRDSQFEEFVREVKTLRQGLQTYIAEGETAHRHLLELATRAEDYYKIHGN